MNTPTLETDRLRLRPFRYEDAPRAFACWESDPDVARYMFWTSHSDIEKTKEWISFEIGQIEKDDWYRFAVVEKETDELIGTALIYYEEEVSSWEIAYNLGKAYWGRGYATEAMQRVIRFATEELHVHEIVGRYAKDNPASGNVMKKLGFQYEKDIPYECNDGAVKCEGIQCRWTINSPQKGMRLRALKAAFPYTIPIFAGFWFLGMTYGIYMNVSGFSFLYPMFMSMTIFAGSMEFVAANLLLGAFNPIQALAMTLMINARHLFYGISMLDKYKGTGIKKFYLIFGMCDESFSVNYTAKIPEDVDRGWFYFFVTLLNQCYWVFGATLGGLFGSLIHFNTEGLEFVMTAMFVVIFMEQWMKEKNHASAFLGLGLSLICLIAFGADQFMIPSMLAILGVLTLLRKPLEKGGDPV